MRRKELVKIVVQAMRGGGVYNNKQRRRGEKKEQNSMPGTKRKI